MIATELVARNTEIPTSMINDAGLRTNIRRAANTTALSLFASVATNFARGSPSLSFRASPSSGPAPRAASARARDREYLKVLVVGHHPVEHDLGRGLALELTHGRAR